MAETGKKKKGKPKSQSKKATISLTEFLADVPSNSPTAPPYRTKSWADESAELNEDDLTTQWPDERPSKPPVNLSSLPSAPRASTVPNVDTSRLPKSPPFIVFLGNLSYEANEEDIAKFFERNKLTSTSVRLVKDKDGRMKGFGYAEFETLGDLMDALSLSGLSLKNRNLQIDVAEGKGDNNEGRRPFRSDDSDRTFGDWRNAPRDSSYSRHSPPPRDYQERGGHGNYSSRSRGGYRSDRYSSPRRWSPPRDSYRDHSPRRDYSRRDHSPPRRDYSRRDHSPPRRDYARRDHSPSRRDYSRRDYSPSRNRRDHSPPRKDYSRRDHSPPRRDFYRRDNSPQRRDYSPRQDHSPPRKDYSPIRDHSPRGDGRDHSPKRASPVADKSPVKDRSPDVPTPPRSPQANESTDTKDSSEVIEDVDRGDKDRDSERERDGDRRREDDDRRRDRERGDKERDSDRRDDGRRDDGRKDDGRRDDGRRNDGRRDDGRRDDGRRDDGRKDDGRRDDGRRDDGRRDDGRRESDDRYDRRDSDRGGRDFDRRDRPYNDRSFGQSWTRGRPDDRRVSDEERHYNDRRRGSGYRQDYHGRRDDYRGRGRSPPGRYSSRRSPDNVPVERPKLVLQPRTKPLEDETTSDTKTSIFGGAKPVDTAKKEREVEERLKAKEKEIKEKEEVKKSQPGIIFGGAKPVDTSKRESEIEERLKKAKEEAERSLEDDKVKKDQQGETGRRRSSPQDEQRTKDEQERWRKEDKPAPVRGRGNRRGGGRDDERSMRGRGRGRSGGRLEKSEKVPPAQPKKYEEPERHDFQQPNRFAALKDQDDGDDSPERQDLS